MDSKSEGYEQERLNILRMVEEDKISANEAASLLSALTQEGKPTSPDNPPLVPDAPAASEHPKGSDVPAEDLKTGSSPYWFRVRVTNLANGRPKATINLPIGLVNWGMRIGARYAPEVNDFDFNELSQILQSGSEGKLIDVIDEEDGEHVEIFVD